MAMSSNESLQREVTLLNGLLDTVLREQAGESFHENYVSLCTFAKARRKEGMEAEQHLSDLVEKLDTAHTRVATRAISTLFDLINVAEDRQRIRVLRARESIQSGKPRSESVHDAIRRLKEADWSIDQLRELLARLDIEPVFTAHPTEAKRRTIREKLRWIRTALNEMDSCNALPREQRRAQMELHATLVALWQSDLLRPERQTVLEEASRALFFTGTLWDVVPELFRDLDEALADQYPGNPVEMGPFLHFGSWIGGDRDGNPFVTAAVTEQALAQLRRAALEKHLEQCRRAIAAFSMSERRSTSSAELQDAVQRAVVRWPQLAERMTHRSAHETYRRWMRIIQWRLEQALLGTSMAESPAGAYRQASQLEADLQLAADSLKANKGDAIFEAELRDWLCRARVFGFHLARLDIREESRRYQEVAAEVLASTGVHADYGSLNEEERQRVLSENMPLRRPVPFAKLSPEAQETLSLFRLMARVNKLFGPDHLGVHVISMTHHASDVLVALWMAEWAACEAGGSPGSSSEFLRLSPLFETIDDLKHAPETLRAMFSNPVYARQIKLHGNSQIVMLGYSDSTKDGGYLSAC